jgi:hypothetical protein
MSSNIPQRTFSGGFCRARSRSSGPPRFPSRQNPQDFPFSSLERHGSVAACIRAIVLLFLSLPLEKLDRLALQGRLSSIGKS